MATLIIVLIIVGSMAFMWNMNMSMLYRRAKSLEEKGKYKEACYQYARVIFEACGSTSIQKDAPERIKYIWKKFGPFDYSDYVPAGKRKSKRQDIHSALLSIIESLVDYQYFREHASYQSSGRG